MTYAVRSSRRLSVPFLALPTIAAWLGTAVPALALTIHVPGDEPTIAAALAVAAAGDTVEVACGTYFESGLDLVSGVVLRSATGQADCVTIDGQRQGRVFSGLQLAANTRLSGIRITGGYDEDGISPDGTATTSTDPDTELARGRPRESEYAPWLRDHGGGAALHVVLSDLVVEDCVFDGNEALFDGGGVRVEDGLPTFRRCRFVDNRAGNRGGALFIGGTAEVTLEDCEILANRAEHGAGLYVSVSVVSAVRTDLVGNFARRNGGGLTSALSTILWRESLVVDNATEPGPRQRGGGAAIFGGYSMFESCTIAKNFATVGGGFYGLSAEADLAKTIVALNTSGTGLTCEGGTTLDLLCCDVFGNVGGPGCGGSQIGIDDNFAADPFFCDPLGGDYELAFASPCVPASSPCGQLVGARDASCDLGGGVLVATEPPGLLVTVDGIVYNSPVAFLWAEGTEHVVAVSSPQSPTPGVRHSFLSWSDGGAISHSITAPDTSLTLTAAFDTEYLLETSASAGGSVDPPSGWHAEASVVTVTATPDSSYLFTGWVGSGAGSYTGPDNPATVTMLGPVEQEALFVYDGAYLLTMTAELGGTVQPESGPRPAGTVVEIEAFPIENYHFENWIGVGNGSYTGSDNPASVTMLSDVSQRAYFAIDEYYVSIASQGEGWTVPGSGNYPYGQVITLNAGPAPGWTFEEWIGTGEGSYSGPDAYGVITVLGNITQTAVFVRGSFTLTMTAGPGGTVVPGDGVYPGGIPVRIEALPDPGYEFQRWVGWGSGSYSGESNPVWIQILDDITQHASFLPIGAHFVTVAVGTGEGTVTPPSDYYAHGSTITLEATPAPGWDFVGWTGTGTGAYTGSENPVDVTVLDDISQSAHFSTPVTLTLDTDPTGLSMVVDGDTTAMPAQYSWGAGTHHDLVAITPQAGAPGHRMVFDRWSDGAHQPARTIIVPASGGSHTAEYHAEVFLDFEDPAEGVSSPGDSWWRVGADVVVYANGIGPWAFESWAGTGNGSYTGPANPATVTMNEPILQVPSFVPFGHDFSISASDVDPFLNEAPPAGGPRSLYLWGTCLQQGLAAFQAHAITDLEILGFQPAPGVLNAGTPTDILLAVGGCPTGDDVNVLLGWWIVADDGGDFCLGPAPPDPFASVDCVDGTPSLVETPRLIGFSSSGAGPCLVEENPCWHPGALVPGSEVRVAVRDRAVELRWQPDRGRDRDGWHLFRSPADRDAFTRVTSEPVPGDLPPTFLDRTVEDSRSYAYRLLEIVGGRPASSSRIIPAETPEWIPTVTAFVGAFPNPFGRDTLFRFSIASRARVRLDVYDVGGRRVGRLLDEERDPGLWEAPWDGRDGQGRRVAAGVYFARLEIGDYRATRKIVRLGGE